MLKKALILLFVGFSPMFAFAASMHFGDYFLKGAERVSDVYVIGETATFAGIVDGDALSVADTIWSESDIFGDAFFIGQEMRLKGSVEDDARLFGGVITIDGTVTDDVVAIGSKVVVTQNAHIGGSLYVIGADVEIQGKVAGGIKVLSSKLLFTGEVQGDMEVWGRTEFKEPSRIGGDFILHSNGKSASPTNVVITGKTIFDEMGTITVDFPFDTLMRGFFSLKVLMMLAFSFALFFLVRERTEEVLLETLPFFGVRVLRGFLIFLVTPFVVLLLISTVVGIPIAMVLGAGMLILCLLSWACSGILLGALCERLFFKRSAFPLSYRPVLLGTLLMSVISLIPFIGHLFQGVFIFATAGSIGTLFFRHTRSKIVSN